MGALPTIETVFKPLCMSNLSSHVSNIGVVAYPIA